MAWPLQEPSDPPPSPMVVEPLRAFQVWGPTTPSTLMPAADCRLRTADRVAGARDPSTARGPGRRVRCVVGGPAAPAPPPRVVEPLSAVQVWGPATPSTLMPAADCRLRTAVRVAGPKDPSTAREAPRSLSLVCRVRTAWPRSP